MQHSADSWLESVPVYLDNPLERFQGPYLLLSFALQCACRQADESAVLTSHEGAVAICVRVPASLDLLLPGWPHATRSECRASCALAPVRRHAMRQHRNRRKAGFDAFA